MISPASSLLAQLIAKNHLLFALTKKEFAQIIGVDVTALRIWERGNYLPLPLYSDALN